MILVTDLQYLAPINEYKILSGFKYITIEQYERWQKAGFRNRCIIGGANGLISLSIPIDGGRNSKKQIRDVKIDNNFGWQKIHWRSVISAYNRSPWFEHYKDEMAVFYYTKCEWLWDWNLTLLKWTMEKLGFEYTLNYTAEWQKDYPADEFKDLRNRVLPNNYHSFAADCPVYRQVFEDRLGFIPNLSIIDLLFCEGPNAARLLKG